MNLKITVVLPKKTIFDVPVVYLAGGYHIYCYCRPCSDQTLPSGRDELVKDLASETLMNM